jgi:uncharacterized membrane protein
VSALRIGAIGAAIALIALALAWELALAPLRPGGSWLALKALPLALLLPGMVRGRRRSFQWMTFLALAYLAEGAVRAWSDAPPARTLALAQAALAVALFLAAAFNARQLGERRQ